MSTPSITPELIRLFLLDRSPSDNFLLDEQEYTPEQLEMALQLTVSKYNTTDPIGVDFQKAETWPYQYEGLLSICSILLKSKAINMVRNRLNYSTKSGVTVDDRKSAEDYIRLAVDFQKEFESRVAKIKMHHNIEGSYNYLNSAFILPMSGSF